MSQRRPRLQRLLRRRPCGAFRAAGRLPKPSRPWSDEILYFVLVDRFADGDPTNDTGADPKAKGPSTAAT